MAEHDAKTLTPAPGLQAERLQAERLQVERLQAERLQVERLLAGMSKVFGHDLPNQLVAVQSLLHMLQLEEGSRLSSDGLEYLQRLIHLAQRAAGQVRFLKEMSRLGKHQRRIEETRCAALCREVGADLAQRNTPRRVEFDEDWQVPRLAADRNALRHALAELLSVLGGPQELIQVHGASRRHGCAVELRFELRAVPAPRGERERAALDQGYELILAREWLHLAGAALTLNPEASRFAHFTLVVPQRDDHGGATATLSG